MSFAQIVMLRECAASSRKRRNGYGEPNFITRGRSLFVFVWMLRIRAA